MAGPWKLVVAADGRLVKTEPFTQGGRDILTLGIQKKIHTARIV